jgi:hypothetical protein
MIYESVRNTQLGTTGRAPSWVNELPNQDQAIEAIRQGDALLFRKALNDGASINSRERPLLIEAVLAGRYTFVGWLLGLGAEVNGCNSRGESAFFAAAQAGDLLTAELLLFYGSQVDLADSWGVTPLMTAVFHGHCPMVIFLTQWGADLSIQNREGLNASAHIQLGRQALARKGRRSIRAARDRFYRCGGSSGDLRETIAQDFESLRAAESEYDLIQEHLTEMEARASHQSVTDITLRSQAAMTAA